MGTGVRRPRPETAFTGVSATTRAAAATKTRRATPMSSALASQTPPEPNSSLGIPGTCKFCPGKPAEQNAEPKQKASKRHQTHAPRRLPPAPLASGRRAAARARTGSDAAGATKKQHISLRPPRRRSRVRRASPTELVLLRLLFPDDLLARRLQRSFQIHSTPPLLELLEVRPHGLGQRVLRDPFLVW